MTATAFIQSWPRTKQPNKGDGVRGTREVKQNLLSYTQRTCAGDWCNQLAGQCDKEKQSSTTTGTAEPSKNAQEMLDMREEKQKAMDRFKCIRAENTSMTHKVEHVRNGQQQQRQNHVVLHSKLSVLLIYCQTLKRCSNKAHYLKVAGILHQG